MSKTLLTPEDVYSGVPFSAISYEFLDFTAKSAIRIRLKGCDQITDFQLLILFEQEKRKFMKGFPIPDTEQYQEIIYGMTSHTGKDIARDHHHPTQQQSQ